AGTRFGELSDLFTRIRVLGSSTVSRRQGRLGLRSPKPMPGSRCRARRATSPPSCRARRAGSCKGASIALCYYSGAGPTTPCALSPDGTIADCTCYQIPEGSPYFVDINAILNLDVYLETVKVCGRDGSACLPTGDKPAPVCDAINDNKLIPNADVISTF